MERERHQNDSIANAYKGSSGEGGAEETLRHPSILAARCGSSTAAVNIHDGGLLTMLDLTPTVSVLQFPPAINATQQAA